MYSELILLPEARSDLAEAYGWYELQSQGLGREYVGAVEATLEAIKRTPLIFPVVYCEYRRALVKRFPFAIFFEMDTNRNCLFVYSIFHCAQDPDKWRTRLPGN